MSRILVVEDHPAERELLWQILKDEGFEVLVAGNGLEGLEAARRGDPDVIITDILMPTMDGYEFVHNLRKEARFAHTPVVFCTAVYEEDEVRQLAESCKVSHFIVKPFGMKSVSKIVRAALSAEAPRGTDAPAPDRDFAREHSRVLASKLLAKIAELEEANCRLTEHALTLEHEIAERKRAERRQRESQEQLRALSSRLQRLREEERLHISREIHDELGQLLTALRMSLSGLQLRMPVLLSEKVDQQIALVDEAIRSVQRISTELRPGLLDDLGLIAAVRWLADDFQTRTGIRCSANLITGEMNTGRDAELAVFRILQEALTNVARHAGATEVVIQASTDAGGWSFEVRDNGRGLSDLEAADPRSLGLLGMRERAEMLGAEVRFLGRPGLGTSVLVRIPRSGTTEPWA